jgi:hypothetical protein
MRPMRALVAAIGIGAASLASLSCTLVSDWDEIKQCSKDADCAKYGSQYAGYACQDDICVEVTCAGADEAAADKSCRDRGGAYADNICEDQMCVEPECKKDEECLDTAPTATCEQGRCVDKVWGCLQAPEPAASPDKLKFQGPVIDFSLTGSRQRLKNGVGKLCRANPPGCATPALTRAIDSEGILSINMTNVLPVGFDGYVRIEVPNFMPTEFYFPRPLRRNFVVEDSTPLAMLTPATIDAFTGFFQGVTIDPDETALITLRLFDCQDNPASNLRLAISDSPQARFYITDEQFSPNLTASATDEAGIAGLANVQEGYQTISVIYNPTGKELYHFTVRTNKRTFVMGFIHAQDVRAADD